MQRKEYLDGLRGVAAAIVVIEHMSALTGGGEWQIGHGTWGAIASDLVNFPSRAAIFAVYVFFAISGVVIAGSAEKNPTKVLIFVSRYLRLTVPMLVSVIVAWALLTLWPNELPKIAEFFPNHWTSTIYQSDAPSFRSVLNEAIWRDYLTGEPYANPVLWSMQKELFGSFGIYFFYIIIRWYRFQFLMIVCAALLATNLPQYLAFPLGAALFELDRCRRHEIGVGAVGLTVVAFAMAIAARTATARYAMLVISQSAGMTIHVPLILNGVGAGIVVFTLMSSAPGQALFSLRLPRFLGRISYSLYLLHMPLLYTVFAAIYLEIGHPPGRYALFFWISSFVAIVTVLATAMTIWIDEPAAQLVKVRNLRRLVITAS